MKLANASVADVGGKKARWVHRAQKALIVAALATIGLTFALIFSPDLLSLKSSNSEPSDAQTAGKATEAGVLKKSHTSPPAPVATTSRTSTVLSTSSPTMKAPH
ncbi:hypothetical protein [Paraburkholderia bryophila]|uniref:hypothetical protein n=1 Tax=Paraburkholderia bryophila TaxID=420952 RepID=UPI0011BE1F99|nr:hypothetical protein [Paraburkholderia bryophila]